MFYVRYFFKCCIRNIAKLICKPKVLLVLFVSVLIIFLLNINTFALSGDDTYTDPNTNIYNAYKTINIDLVNRLNNSSNTSLVNGLKNYIKTGSSYYVYYGEPNGTSMLGGGTFEFRNLYVLIYNKNSTYSSTAIYDTYQGLTCNVRMYNKPSGFSLDNLYCFNGNTLSYVNLENVYIPTNLINYFDEYVVNYINDNSSTQNQQIIEKLEEQKNIQEEQKNIQEEQKNFITNTTVEDSSMTINTDGLGLTDDQGVNDFFTNMLNTIKNTFMGINSTVETIEIPIPFTDDNLVLSSDLVSKHIQGTTIYALIQALWWFVIGKYIVMFSYRMIAWLSTGKIADKGISSFIDYLDKNNEIINSYMM